MTSPLPNRWNEQDARNLNEQHLLLYRSNLLGKDKRVTNYGGGNTSAKVSMLDPLSGSPVDVLWVKGSGGDVGTMTIDGFSTLYLDKLNALKSLYRGVEYEDEMVGYLPHCAFNLNPRAASIDTALHAYLPYKHVDHMHPDAIIAIAAAEDGEKLTKQIFGDEIGWLPWKRPGFELGLSLETFARQNPDAKGVILGSHGLFTWADDARKCYDLTIDVINKAQMWIAEKSKGVAAFGGAIATSLSSTERAEIAMRLMPIIRGQISNQFHLMGHFNDDTEVLEFVNSAQLAPLAYLGTSCPDHFLRTKIRPLVIEFDTANPDIDAVISALPDKIEAYRNEYSEYYHTHKNENSPPLRDPNAVVFLMPGVGMMTFAKDKATARTAGEFYVNAINVMRGASSVSTYQGLPLQEAFDIEYWLLEEAKLQRMPKPRSLAGKVALITGGAGGIGSATARRLLAEGACVMLVDIDANALAGVSKQLADEFSADVVATSHMDVTDENAVIRSFGECSKQFGGVDILVSNAGIASSAPIEDTSLELWDRNQAILSTGYFLVSREAFRVMKQQDLGGAIIFIASKNGLAASPNASAYCAAKASEIHLARCLALEGAPAGIRVNTVNPDAVLQGSKIWSGEWLDARAKSYQTDKDGLVEKYKERSLLKREVLPSDIAEATYFFASEFAAKSTGNILNVDAGNINSFTR